MFQKILDLIEIWVALNLTIPGFIIYRRSPHVRQQLFRWTIGRLLSMCEREPAPFAVRRHP
jgi:hypothetical protein